MPARRQIFSTSGRNPALAVIMTSTEGGTLGNVANYALRTTDAAYAAYGYGGFYGAHDDGSTVLPGRC